MESGNIPSKYEIGKNDDEVVEDIDEAQAPTGAVVMFLTAC